MKQTALIITIILIAFSSCHFGGRSKTVVINNDEGYTKIQYKGDFSINDEGTNIEYLSPDGFIKYKHNGQKITIECNDEGDIIYKVNGNRSCNYQEVNNKEFVKDALKDIEYHYTN